MAGCEFLSEDFAAFEPGRGRRWPDHAKTARAKHLTDASDQRSLGTNNGEVSSNRLSEVRQSVDVVHIGGYTGCYFNDCSIAGWAGEFCSVWVAWEFAGDGMWSAAGA